MESIHCDIAKTDYDFLCAEKLIKTACVNHFNITRENGTAVIGDWSKDGVRFDDERFRKYFKLIVRLSTLYGRGCLSSPCIFVAKHEDGRVLCALLVVCIAEHPDRVCFAFVSTIPEFRHKGLAVRLSVFAAIQYIARGLHVVIAPDNENAAALKTKMKVVSQVDRIMQGILKESK